MRIKLAILIALSALSTQVFAQTTRPVWPAPPQVTVGANLKELVFDWEPVPGAVIYRVLQKTTDNSREYFAPISDRLRRTRAAIPISVHQQLWNSTRYVVLACNLAGCTRSAEVFPRDLMLDTIGYLKASNTGANDGFGRQVAASADGSTIAVSAEGEDSNATGVNGDQTNNSASNSGAVYVYRRNGRNWSQEAYLKPPDVQAGGRFGAGSPYRLRTLDLSANGSRLLIGAPASSVSGLANAGSAYLFERDSASHWSVGLELHAPVPAADDYFGYSVDLTSDGNMLKVNSLLPIEQDSGDPEGRTHLWIHSGNSWTYQLAPRYAGDLCRSTRLSADGRTLVSYCLSTAEDIGRVRTLKRQPDNSWTFAPDIMGPWIPGAHGMAITYSGSWLAVYEGSIGMYRWDGSRWVRDVTILPWSVSDGPGAGWAESLEFSRNGEFLAIGDPSARIFGAGVSDPTIGSERDGAVVIYKHRPESIPQWYSFKTVKASNPGVDDAFGTSVAFAGSGWYLAIAAPQEDGAARGVDGDQSSEAATDSGAVYLY